VLLLALCATLGAAQQYGQALSNSILFFEAQRSGSLPSNNRVAWRGDSAMFDGDDNNLDLTGGWYDAGDHVKFNFPMAGSATLLAWSVIDFESAYQSLGELQNARDQIRWVSDYFLLCDSDANELYAQVGDGHADHAFWGRPEHMTMARPSFALDTGKPGSDLAGETAAALAAASMVFEDNDSGYSGRLLTAARRIYDFAYNNRGLYMEEGQVPAGDFYGSSGDRDELAHGAVWLYRATREPGYLNQAQEFYSANTPWALSWDAKDAAVQMLMHIVNPTDGQYENHVRAFLQSWSREGGITYTPGGLAWRDQWGPNRYAANTAFISVMAKQYGLISDDWAKGQVDYMLGNNPKGISYAIGYTGYYPQRPHHRAASCPADINQPCSWDDYNRDAPNPNVLIGALVGGPDQNDEYNDDRADYISNEVACDYNAGWQGALAGLVALTDLQ